MKKVKEDIKKKTVPQKKMFLLDESEKISIEELDSRIQAPHKINLSEFDLSKSSLCLSEQKQIELFTQNLNAQSNILDESNNSSNSLSRGQAVSESNSEIHQNVYDNKLIYNENNNERNRTGLDLLRLKEFNENLKKINPLVYAKSNHVEKYAWKLENIKKYDKPIPCKGKLGLWNYELEV